ncbi:MAG: hypothetical protein RL685_5085 [Pseudomonadota bacterium]|jgi:hypothetical protein
MKSISNAIVEAQELDDQTLSSVQGGVVLLMTEEQREHMREQALELGRKGLEGQSLRRLSPPTLRPPLFGLRP